ncbi:MAG: outer membrane beta-barrel protein [Bacteroidota bacterium]
MENNFDKYFKEKLENRQFEMKPEYWEQAEALIEADQRQEWWKRSFIWWGTLLVFVTLGFFIWVKINNPTTDGTTQKNTVVAVEENAPVTKDANTTNSFPMANDNSFSNKANTNTSSQKAELNDQANAPTQFSENTVTAASSTNPSRILPTKEEQADISKTTVTKTNPTAEVDNLNDKVLNKSATELEPNNSITDNNFNKENTTKEDQSVQNKISEDNSDQTAQPTSPIASTTNTEERNFQQDPPKAEVFPMIASLNFLLESDQEKWVDLDIEKHLTPPSSKRETFSFGVGAGAVGYPLIENSTPQRFIGFKAGAFVEYNFKNEKFAKQWSLGSELLYHFRTGNFLATKENLEVQYSFGRSTTANQLTPRNLHYVELPLYLKYHSKKTSFELGGAVSYLAGVQGTLDQAGEKTSGLMPRFGFKKYHANILLGTYFHLSDRLRFGVRANFTPGGILDKNAGAPNQTLRESGPLYLTFRVNQYFNRKK